MRLFGISFSPWTEKARWALDHHRIDYTFEEHIPVIGELRLKVLMREPTRRVTVPVLKDDRWYTDSFDIARHADRLGSAARLLPEDRLGEIAAWNTRSEAALAAGRAMLLLKSSEDPKLVRATIPPGVPAMLQPLLMPLARQGMKAFIQKYRMREGEGGHERVLREVLDALAVAVSAERPYLLGEFSYADIAMAMTLQPLSPVEEAFMPIGLGGREAWENRELAALYPGLLKWRDALYAKHRRQAVRSA
jgi:glutathione S-transferase